MSWVMLGWCLVLTVIQAARTVPEIAFVKPSLTLYTISACQSCNDVMTVWETFKASTKAEGQGGEILIDEINCSFQEETCVNHGVSEFPSILFESSSGVREFEGEATVDALTLFLQESDNFLLEGGSLLSEEEKSKVLLSEDDLDILGKTHALVYFTYDDEEADIVSFTTSLKNEIEKEFDLPVFAIKCSLMPEICADEPFYIVDLPCIKFMGERLVTLSGEFRAELILEWLKRDVFKIQDDSSPKRGTADVDEAEVFDEDEEDDEEDEEDGLVYVTSKTLHQEISKHDGFVLTFLDVESDEMEEVIRKAHKENPYKDTIAVLALSCENELKYCRSLSKVPITKSGFMGHIVREDEFINFSDIMELLHTMMDLISTNKEFLLKSKGKVFELEERNFGTEISRHNVTFVYYYTTSSCSRCVECEAVWVNITRIYTFELDVLPARVDCNRYRGLCKQGDTKGGSRVNVYYKGVFHTYYKGEFKFDDLYQWCESLRSKRSRETLPEDVINKDEKDSKSTTDSNSLPENTEDETIDSMEPSETKSGNVVILTESSFDRVLADNRLVFVKFFVPWCGHCQRLKPTWKSLGSSFKDVEDIVIGMVNCQNVQELCRKYTITTYPTLIPFARRVQKHRYRGTRTLYDLIEFVKEKYYEDVEQAIAFSDQPFLITSQNLWNILGTRKYTILYVGGFEEKHSNYKVLAELYQGLYKQLNGLVSKDALIATADCYTDIGLCAKLSITTVPYFVIFDGDRVVDGEPALEKPFIKSLMAIQKSINKFKKIIDIKSAVEEYNAAKSKGDEIKTKSNSRKGEKTAIKNSGATQKQRPTYVKTQAVEELGVDNFSKVLKKSRFTFVKFMAPWCGHCKRLAPVWKRLGEEFMKEHDIIIATVNCDIQDELCDKYKVAGYPTLIMFDNNNRLTYRCKLRKEEDLRDYISSSLASDPLLNIKGESQEMEKKERRLYNVRKGVISLSRDTFETYRTESPLIFVKFYTTWCPHCQKLAPTWNRLGDMYLDEKSVTIAKVDCDAERVLCSDNKIKSFPTLIMFDRFDGSSKVAKERGEYTLAAFVDGFLERHNLKTPIRDEL